MKFKVKEEQVKAIKEYIKLIDLKKLSN